MKLVKCLAVAATAALCAMPVMAEEAPAPDFAARINCFLPQNSEDWDSAGNFEMQARFWSSPTFGTALCVGMGSWVARNEYSESSDDSGSMSTSIYGDATVIPIGVSLLYRNTISGRVALTFEAGVRYIYTRSNLNAEISSEDANGTSLTRDLIYIDNPFVGVVGVTIENTMADGLSLVWGLGYQFDLTNPRETFMGDEMGSTSFNSAMINVGLTWEF